MKDIVSLRNHLFAALDRLTEASDKNLDNEIAKAASIVQVSETIIKTAEVENQFIAITKGIGSGFIPIVSNGKSVTEIEDKHTGENVSAELFDESKEQNWLINDSSQVQESKVEYDPLSISEIKKEKVKSNFNDKLLKQIEVSDGFCAYCGDEMNFIDKDRKEQTTEHILCKENGGTDSPLNKIPVCRDCNEWKANNSLEYFLEQIQYRLRSNGGGTKESINRLMLMNENIQEIIKAFGTYKPDIKKWKPVAE